MEKNIKIMIFRTLILVLGGMFFIVFQKWFILPIFAIIWFLFELSITKEKKMKYLKIAVLIGIFLMIFDFMIENLGGSYGYWRTIDSSFFVFFVPIEIMLTCIFGGAGWSFFISKNNNKFFILVNLIIWSIGGVVGEAFLISIEFMNYGNGWFSIPHAFVSYFFTFALLYLINYSLIKRIIK